VAAGAQDGDPIGDIESGRVAPGLVYCLHGAERYLIDRFVAALRAAVLAADGGKVNAFNQETLDIKENGLGAVLNAAKTLPMFARRRLVLARGIDQLKSDDLEPLGPYLADPNPSTCLVLVGDKIDGRLRVFQTLRKAGHLHEFPRLRDRELGMWLAREAAARKIPLDKDAALALADSAGPDLGRMSLALDQLALFAGEGTRITRDHVEALVSETRERSVFELTKAIGAGDRTRALRLLTNMLRNREPPLRIQFMLLRQLRQIWTAKELAGAGVPRMEIASHIGLPPFFLDDALVPARRMSVATLERSLRRLHTADRMLKSSRVDPDVQIARLVMGLAEDAAGSSAGIRTG
jgi:DNA polymerase-3 subunit delta